MPIRINQYFDGKKSDDEILYRAEISKKQLREVLHHYEEYVGISCIIECLCLIADFACSFRHFCIHRKNVYTWPKSDNLCTIFYISLWCQPNKAAALEQSNKLSLPINAFPALMGTSGYVFRIRDIVSSSNAV